MITEIGDRFLLPTSFNKSILDTFKTIKYQVTLNHPPKSPPTWIQYQRDPSSLIADNVFVFRGCKEHFPEVAEYTADYLSKIVGVPLFPEHVIFTKTIGSVPWHIDDFRKTCINIGIDNTESGITKIQAGDGTIIECMVKVNHAYLLDVSKPHAVDSIDGSSRLMISYGLNTNFFKMLNIIRRK